MKKLIFMITFLVLLVSCSPASTVSQVIPLQFESSVFAVDQGSKNCRKYDLRNRPENIRLRSTDKAQIEYTASPGLSMGFEVAGDRLVLCAYSSGYPVPRVEYPVQIKGQVSDYQFSQTMRVLVNQGKRYFEVASNLNLSKDSELCKPIRYSKNGDGIYTNASTNLENSISFFSKTGILGEIKSINSLLNLCLKVGTAIPGSHNVGIFGHMNGVGINIGLKVNVPR
jgi:hypothetical protein